MSKSPMKLQSAMEYLMTYGWAILIIAVVLIGLNYLGIFNSETFAPKASPGACYVLRTAAQVSLTGECNGYIPRSVGQFDGASSYIEAPLATSAVVGTTMSLWFYDTGVGGTVLLLGSAGNTNGYGIYTGGGNSGCASGQIDILQSGVQWICTGVPISENAWYNVVLVSSSSGASHVVYTIYLNGTNVYTSSAEGLPNTPTSYTFIGYDTQLSRYFKGQMADVQVYNTSLSASDVQTLYAEGIGGIPININRLVGWWPLNGDTVDYSGNMNNGVNNKVAFNANWYATYTPT